MKLKSIYGLALAALAAGAAVTACTDANDWDTNPAFDRMFGVNSNKISIETNQEDPSTVNVTFNPIKGAEYYIIEVSTDSLTDEVEMGGENATVYGEDKSLTKSPATLVNMREETSYYMRMKTMSSTTPESKWVYYNLGAPFKTLGIIYDVPSADILENSVTLRWITKTGTVTHITYTTSENGQDVTETRTLTDAEIAAGVCTITGLKENKTYKFAIYNGEVLRGTKTVKTAKAMPWATVRQELGDDVTQIDQELMDMLAQKALDIMAAEGKDTASVTIGVPAGKTLTLGTTEESLNVPEGISVTFFGLAGEVPTLQVYKSLDVAGNHGYVRFEHINVDGMYDGDAGVKGCEYVINQEAACSIDSLSFVECNISNLNSALVRIKSGDYKEINKLRIDNCIVTNHAGAYQFLCFAKVDFKIDDIEITNSTFNKICQGKKTFIDLENSAYNTNINVEGCTFYNLLGDGAYLISAKGVTGSVNATFFKVLLAKTYTEKARGYQGDNITISAPSSYLLSDFVFEKNKLDMFNTYNGNSSDVFTDPASGDFTLKVNDLIREEVGDPRWYTTQ
jgi:hypothetical protein